MTWETVPLGELLAESRELQGQRQALEPLTLTEGKGFVLQRDKFKKRVALEDTSKYKVVRRGAIAYNPYLLWAGAIAQNNQWDEAVVSPAYPVFMPTGRADTRYLWHMLQSPLAAAEFDAISFGAIPRRRRAAPEAFLRVGVPLPPLPEQRRIAAILDEADALRASQSAIISGYKTLLKRYVAEHITPIPRARPVSAFGTVQLGRQRAPKYQTGKESTPYMRVANVHEDRVDTSDVLSMDFSANDRETYGLAPGDILLNEGQSTELVGRPAIWRGEIDGCCFQNTLVRFRPYSEKCLTEFAQMVFLGWLWNGDFQRVSSKTSNIAHLGASRFAAMPFPALAVAEQLRHAEFYRELSRATDDARVRHKELDALFASLQHRAFRGEL